MSRNEGAAPTVDELAIERLIRRWIVLRDNGQWEQLRPIWHPDGRMKAGWREGTADEFIAASKAGWGKGLAVFHVLGATAIELANDRAVSQNKMIISARGNIGAVACESATMGRHVDCWERREGYWGLVSRETIYDRDNLFAVVPGETIPLNREDYVRLPPEYRCIGYLLGTMGFPMSDTMPVFGSAGEQDCLDRAAKWLRRE